MIAYITELNSENFKMFTNNEFSLVDIWAPWCGPCKLIAPMVDEVSSEYHGQLSVGKLVKDSEGNPVKLVGSVQKDRLKEVIDENL